MLTAKELKEITSSSARYLQMVMEDLEPKLRKLAEEGKSEFIYSSNARGDGTTEEQKTCGRYDQFTPPPMWKLLEAEFKRLGFGFRYEQYYPKVGSGLGMSLDDDERSARQSELDRRKHFHIKITW